MYVKAFYGSPFNFLHPQNPHSQTPIFTSFHHPVTRTWRQIDPDRKYGFIVSSGAYANPGSCFFLIFWCGSWMIWLGRGRSWVDFFFVIGGCGK